MTLAIYTKTELDSVYLITYVRLYFVISKEVRIRLGSFIVRNFASDIINATQAAIQRPLSSPELAAALALLDQKYAERSPELLQRLWTLASTEDPPTLINSVTSSVTHLPHDQTPAGYQLAKRQRATSDPDSSKRPRRGDTDPDEPSSPHAE
ncbi:hypothetical protein H1R20_g12344, partial [Candolleomyces eurysporus]